jgi:hypothetical protein
LPALNSLTVPDLPHLTVPALSQLTVLALKMWSLSKPRGAQVAPPENFATIVRSAMPYKQVRR